MWGLRTHLTSLGGARSNPLGHSADLMEDLLGPEETHKRLQTALET